MSSEALHLYNNLTRKKELFVPIDKNKIKWYHCDRTDHVSRHIGHARSYISMDIIRRVLQDYFGYDVHYYWNINDISEQIIQRTESNFFDDMKRLHVEFPNVITRVSQYIPMIIQFIEKLIENGYAYQSNSLVYFDTIKYHQQHPYAKVEHTQIDDVAALHKGEDASRTADNTSNEKKNQGDFVLWKKSEADELVWQSPWGLGRPGGHIGCGVRASTGSSSQFDIHSGDIDSKFLHHNNEIAQSDVYAGIHPWLYYLHHSYHLTIADCQTSESLENIVTIQQAIHQYSPRQLRLLCLLHSWLFTLDYSDHQMEKVAAYEKMLDDFFRDIQTRIDQLPLFDDSTTSTNMDDNHLNLQEYFSRIKNQINSSLCDSIDTPSVMENIKQLILSTEVYIHKEKSIINHVLLNNIAQYIAHLMNIFGLNSCQSDPCDDDDIQLTGNERVELNDMIIIPNKEIIPPASHVINGVLAGLDFRLEDQGDEEAIIMKFCDTAIVKSTREETSK